MSKYLLVGVDRNIWLRHKRMEQFPQIWTERRKLKKTRNKNFYKINSTAKNTECSQKKMHRYLYRESCLKNSSSKNIHCLIQFAKKIKQEVVFLSLKIWMHCEMVVLISTFLPHFSVFSLGLKMAEAATVSAWNSFTFEVSLWRARHLEINRNC